MRRLLNTIYVTSEDAWLRKDRENIVIEIDGAEKGVPLHMLEGLVCFNRAGVSPGAMAACAERGIALSFLQPNGRFLARVEGQRSGNVLLRRAQYRIADDPARALPVVRGIVAGKAANQRTVIMRALRDHGATASASARDALQAAALQLSHAARRTLAAADVAELRGVEETARASTLPPCRT
jgi:CRISPR-associated protein Cas1